MKPAVYCAGRSQEPEVGSVVLLCSDEGEGSWVLGACLGGWMDVLEIPLPSPTEINMVDNRFSCDVP